MIQTSYKEQFLNYPNIDPKTKEYIDIGGKRFIQLTEKYGYPIFKSPQSGYKIAVGKGTYNKLIKEGNSEDYLLSLLNLEIINYDYLDIMLLNHWKENCVHSFKGNTT